MDWGLGRSHSSEGEEAQRRRIENSILSLNAQAVVPLETVCPRPVSERLAARSASEGLADARRVCGGLIMFAPRPRRDQLLLP